MSWFTTAQNLSAGGGEQLLPQLHPVAILFPTLP